MSQAPKQYFNQAQQYLLTMNPRNLIAVCGRGFGKGAVQAGRLQTAFQGMPGSMGGFVAPSVKRCLTNILPSMLIHLERWGFRRDVHYTVGKKPWKALHWREPIFTPANWENTIAFYNGSVCSIISQDRTGTSNSMSLDYVIIDEAKFIDPEQLRNETLLANRGNTQYFGQFYLHHGLTITSDMPSTKRGAWFLNYEQQMQPDLVATLWFACRKIATIKKQMAQSESQNIELQKTLQQWRSLRDQLRADTTLYTEFSTLENIDLLTEDYIRRMKEELSPGQFREAILNQRQRVQQDGFYSALDEDRNLYTASNQSYLQGLDYDFQKLQQEDCRMDSDLDPALPIIVAFDANSNFNCLVCGQQQDQKLRILKSFYVKYQRKLPELVDDFAQYYSHHRTRKVIFYFDATFKGTVTGIHANELYVIIERAFKAHQWTVQRRYIGRPMNHQEKNLLINQMLQGHRQHLILINRDNNLDLITSIENAAVRNDKKDKSGEKVIETEEDQLQTRTDFSDAFDTLCIGVELFPIHTSRSTTPNTYSR